MTATTEQKLRLTQVEAAAYCQMSVKTFCDWRKVREIKTVPLRPGRKSRRYLTKHLDEFLAWLETDEADEAAASYDPSSES